MEASAATSPPPKFSRYRTVRERAATLQTLSSQSDNEPLPPPLPKASTFAESGQDTTVKRAPSRYRRNNAPTAVQSPPLPSAPIPAILHAHATVTSPVQKAAKPSRYHQPKDAHTIKSHGTAGETTDQQSARPPDLHTLDTSRQPPKDCYTTKQPRLVSPEERYELAREEARLILEGEYDRLHQLKKKSEREQQAFARGPQAPPDLNRRRHSPPPRATEQQIFRQKTTSRPAEDEAAAPVCVSLPPTAPKQRPTDPVNQNATNQAPESANVEQSSNVQLKSPTRGPPKVLMESKPATATSAPTFDAPVSAVNAGDRRVTVRYQTSEITLPVTTSTTAKDLLNSASVVLSNPPDPRTSTLIESYNTSNLDLERPIRRYERIRDILNSWDSDTSNHLLILGDEESQTEARIHGLDLKDVPAHAGRDITLQMHHCSHRRGGRWDKRWVRLREDGQVTVSKHESGTDSTNVCHLSDFDLYAPTRKQVKRLRAPKKTVFAVKSQQKSAMFLEANGANFAHFFCSGTKEVADQWYAAVHGWRSWYLVNVMGEGKVPAAGTGEVLGDRPGELKRPSTKGSADTVPYQLGSFKPLLDFDALANGAEGSDGGRQSVDHHRRQGSDLRGIRGGGGGGSPRRSATLRHHHTPPLPPVSFPGAAAHARGDSIPGTTTTTISSNPDSGGGGLISSPNKSAPSGFTGKGLLAAFATNPAPTFQAPPTFGLDDPDAAFTGRGLLARSGTQRSSQGGRGTGRGVSGVGVAGKPLVDLASNSAFEDGSLLRKLEAWRAVNGGGGGDGLNVRVDRDKRVEGMVRSGEGF